MARYEEEQAKDDDRNCSEQQIEQDTAMERRAAVAPVAQFRPVGHTDLVLMLEIPSHLPSRGVAVLGIALEGAVDDLLQLGCDRRIDFAGGTGLFSRRSFMMAKALGP